MPQPRIHKLLLGDRAGEMLPYALARLRDLTRDMGSDTHWTQHYIVGDFHVVVRQVPPGDQFIRIEAGTQLAYEFFTSEHIADDTLTSPGHFDGLEFAYVCGSATRARFKPKSGAVAKTTPLSSSSLTPSFDGPQWNVPGCEDSPSPETRFITWQSWQNQKFFEYQWHPNNDGKSLVMSTLAQAPGWLNQAGLYSPYCWVRFGNTQSFISDYTLDIPATLYTKGGLISGAPLLEHGWLYWRHAAKHGNFFIQTDNYGRFHVYRVKDWGASQFAIPPSHYKTYTPPYPAWVTVPAVSDFTRQFAQWLWRFNKDATRCVSIPFHSAENAEFKKYLNNSSFFCAILPEDASDIIPALAVVNSREDTPGLVEFGIEITEHGPGDTDFDVTFTLRRSSFFETSNRFFFDAAYFMKDVERTVEDPDFIAEDTLMTAELVCTTPPGYFTPGPWTNAWATGGALDSCRQLYASVVINANWADDPDMTSPDQKFTFPAIGPAWFQFPTADGVRGGAFGPPQEQFIPIAAGGTRAYKPAGPSIYDPDGVVIPGRIWFGPLAMGVTYGFLYSLDLTTLSLCYEIDDEIAGTFSIRTVAYGKEFYRLDGDLGYTLPGPEAVEPTPVVLLTASSRVTSFRPHQAMFNFVINTAPGDGFTTHPAGHFAFNLGALRNADLPLEADLDWISVFRGVDEDGNALRTRHKHRDLFNRAFVQTRPYSFYHEDFPGRILGDYGSFRTAGAWITFR